VKNGGSGLVELFMFGNQEVKYDGEVYSALETFFVGALQNLR